MLNINLVSPPATRRSLHNSIQSRLHMARQSCQHQPIHRYCRQQRIRLTHSDPNQYSNSANGDKHTLPPTETPTNAPVPPTPTNTPTPSGGSVTHSNVNDFAESCVVADDVEQMSAVWAGGVYTRQGNCMMALAPPPSTPACGMRALGAEAALAPPLRAIA